MPTCQTTIYIYYQLVNWCLSHYYLNFHVSSMSFVVQSIYSDTPLQSVVVRVIIQIFSALARLCSKSSLPFQQLIRSRQSEWISLIPKSKFTGRESRRDHQTSWFYFWFYSAASHLIHLSSLYVPPTSTLHCIPRRSLTSNQVINKHKAKNPAKEPLQNHYNHLLSSGLIYFRVSRIHYLVHGKTIVKFGPRIASPTQDSNHSEMITRWSHDLLFTVVAGCCSALASFVRHIHPSPHGGDPTVYSPIRPGQLMISAKRPTTEVTKAVHHQQKNKNWCRLNHLSPIVRSRRLSLRVANKKNWGTTPQHSPVLASRKNI